MHCPADNTLHIQQHVASEHQIWQRLFDGKTLSGWATRKGCPITTGWIVEDGCIFRKHRGGDIYTVGEYEKFELELEWKISPKGNCGVKYRFKAGLSPEYKSLMIKGTGMARTPSPVRPHFTTCSHAAIRRYWSQSANSTQRASLPMGQQCWV